MVGDDLPVDVFRLAKPAGAVVTHGNVHRLGNGNSLGGVGLHETPKQLYSTVFPPLTDIFCPVMNAAASEARNATVSPTSFGIPIRFSAVRDA